MGFVIEVSARHVHVSRKDLDILFGKGHELTFVKALSQPGQFLAQEKVTVKNGEKTLNNVSILGPCRPASQVEVSKTDTITLKAPGIIRESGVIDGTPGVTIVGPCGEVTLDKGLIVAKRHIHMTPADAEKFGVSDKQVVSVVTDSTDRRLVFGDVVVRVHSNFSLAMHIDTDEANAANISPLGAQGTICEIK